jgi:hypothetical protein
VHKVRKSKLLLRSLPCFTAKSLSSWSEDSLADEISRYFPELVTRTSDGHAKALFPGEK